MKILFIISASIAIKKCYGILAQLTNQKIFIDCIVTNNAKKMISSKDLKKNISGKIYSDSSEKNNTMFHIKLKRKTDLILVKEHLGLPIPYQDNRSHLFIKFKVIYPDLNDENIRHLKQIFL